MRLKSPRNVVRIHHFIATHHTWEDAGLELHLQISWSRLAQRGSNRAVAFGAKAGTVERADHMTGIVTLTMRLGRLDHRYSWLLYGATGYPGSMYIISHVVSQRDHRVSIA
jgi:hypothetical protein